MTIPKTAANPVDAMMMMDYFYRPRSRGLTRVHQLRHTGAVHRTSSPNTRRQSAGDDKKTLEAILTSPLVYPTAADLPSSSATQPEDRRRAEGVPEHLPGRSPRAEHGDLRARSPLRSDAARWIWLAIFLWSSRTDPAAVLADDRDEADGYQFTLHWQNYTAALTTTIRSSPVPGVRRSRRARYRVVLPIAYWIAFKGGARKSTYLS